MLERQRRRDLEERCTEPLRLSCQAVEKGEDFLLTDRNVVDENPLPKVDEVWRRVPPDAKPARSKDRVGGGDDASLPVGATDVQHGQRAMRIAEQLEQRVDALETELPDAGRAREQRIDRGAVVTQGDVHPAAAGCPLMWRSS